MRASAARLEPTPIIDFVHAVQLPAHRAPSFGRLGVRPPGRLRQRHHPDSGSCAALYPFDNTLRAVRISGAQLKEYLEHSARYYRADPAGRSRSMTRCPATTST